MLKDRVFTNKEFQDKVVCQLNLSQHAASDWVGTMTNFLDDGKKTSVDYWNCLWMAMQFFSPNVNRKIARDCVMEAIKKEELYRNEFLSDCCSHLEKIDQMTDQDFMTVNNAMRVKLNYEKSSMVVPDKNKYMVMKSAVAIFSDKPNESCPVVLLSLRPIVGAEFIDKLVRYALEIHP